MAIQKQTIPVYLICGFLEAGKTNFIAPMMTGDDFTKDERTLLVVTEEGEEEYDEEKMLDYKVRMVTFDEKSDFTRENLIKYENKYHPTQVLMEYNGMWDLQDLNNVLPDHWQIYQIVTIVDATTFEQYQKNIPQQMSQHIMNAQMVIFNRCTDELAEMLRGRKLKVLNRRGDIYLEYSDGRTEQYDDGTPPFDLDLPLIDLSDDDFSTWYVDVMDNPERYEGKKVSYLAQVAKNIRFGKNAMACGRFAMVCCAADTSFLAVLCKGDQTKNFENKDWCKITGTVHVEKNMLYHGNGPVLYIDEAVKVPAPDPQDQLVY